MQAGMHPGLDPLIKQFRFSKTFTAPANPKHFLELLCKVDKF